MVLSASCLILVVCFIDADSLCLLVVGMDCIKNRARHMVLPASCLDTCGLFYRCRLEWSTHSLLCG